MIIEPPFGQKVDTKDPAGPKVPNNSRNFDTTVCRNSSMTICIAILLTLIITQNISISIITTSIIIVTILNCILYIYMYISRMPRTETLIRV